MGCVFLHFIANGCSGPFSTGKYGHAVTITATGSAKTGDTFTATCDEGYSPSEDSGILICDENSLWTNKATCLGMEYKILKGPEWKFLNGKAHYYRDASLDVLDEAI